MKARLTLVGVVVAALCAGSALAISGALAAAPAGPRLAFLEWQVGKPLTRSISTLQTAGPDGESPQVVAGRPAIEPNPLGGESWTPDGAELAFVGTRGMPESKEKPWIYLIGAEGGTPRKVAGTRGGSRPVPSPDGTELAFSRHRESFHLDPKHPIPPHSYSSTSAWIVPLAGGKPRQLTPWRNGRFESPSSFSPDGRLLALDRSPGPGRGPEAVALDLRSHRTRVIATEAENPVYSPDGSKVALVSYRDHITSGEGEERTAVGELYVVGASGQNPVRLTSDRERQEASPSWDPSGRRIAYVQETAHWAVGLTGVVMEVNADGSCQTMVLGTPREEGKYGPPLGGPGFYSPAWQPGPGREAGPIEC